MSDLRGGLTSRREISPVSKLRAESGITPRRMITMSGSTRVGNDLGLSFLLFLRCL